MTMDLYMWVGYPVSPYFEKWIGTLEGIDYMIDNLVKRGFNGIVIGPFSAIENPEGKRQYGPFNSEIYRESLKQKMGSNIIKADFYHPFCPTEKYYQDTIVRAPYVSGCENSGKKYFKQVMKVAKDKGLKVYYLWMSATPINEFAPINVQTITDVFGNKKGFICINTPGFSEYMAGYLKDILDNYSEINGIILDLLQFPSYTADLLFTCFCEACHNKAEEHGYAFNDFKRSALKIFSQIKNLDKEKIMQISDDGLGPIDTMAEIFSDENFVNWWNFKFSSINEFAQCIRNIVNDINPSLELNIDCVSPSFTPLFGVSLKSLRKYADVVNPKFYPSEDLFGWRGNLISYANFIRENREKEIEEHIVIKFLAELLNLKEVSKFKTLNELREASFSVEIFKNEVNKAVNLFGDKKRIKPWVRLDYALTSEIKNMIKALSSANLGGAIFRYYAAATEKKFDIIQKEFKKY
ncbi:MAG: hypothetical protein QXJ06_04925 [Candidatus Aenigmatarchaeota archaeon]